MFRKGRKVIYPVYGPGKIVDIFTEEVGEDAVEYFDIEFLNTNLTVSIPVEEAIEFGLRYPLSEKELKKALKALDEKVRISKTLLDDIDEFTSTRFKSGTIEDAIEVVNQLRRLAQRKLKQDKKLSAYEMDKLEKAIYFIRSEVHLVMGATKADLYDLEIIK
ncbi:MAG: CarD family transcriptional regulator [Candidatus Dojkabacteria bacterium]